jgi:FkbM family methyltransferase
VPVDSFRITNEYGSIDYYTNDQEMVKQILPNLFFEQKYVEEWLTQYIENSTVALDIGAHCGSHTLMYKKIKPDLLVYAFEPQSMMHDLLCKNVIMNQLANVWCFNKAVGNISGKVEMNECVSDGHNPTGRIRYGTRDLYNLAGLEVGSGGEVVEMIRIDDYDFPKIDFMKIDVEGYEPLVIEGAVETIKRDRPIISYESNSKRAEGVTRSSHTILTNMGYACRNVWGDNWLAIY